MLDMVFLFPRGLSYLPHEIPGVEFVDLAVGVGRRIALMVDIRAGSGCKLYLQNDLHLSSGQ